MNHDIQNPIKQIKLNLSNRFNEMFDEPMKTTVVEMSKLLKQRLDGSLFVTRKDYECAIELLNKYGISSYKDYVKKIAKSTIVVKSESKVSEEEKNQIIEWLFEALCTVYNYKDEDFFNKVDVIDNLLKIPFLQHKNVRYGMVYLPDSDTIKDETVQIYATPLKTTLTSNITKVEKPLEDNSLPTIVANTEEKSSFDISKLNPRNLYKKIPQIVLANTLSVPEALNNDDQRGLTLSPLVFKELTEVKEIDNLFGADDVGYGLQTYNPPSEPQTSNVHRPSKVMTKMSVVDNLFTLKGSDLEKALGVTLHHYVDKEVVDKWFDELLTSIPDTPTKAIRKLNKLYYKIRRGFKDTTRSILF